MTFEKIKKAFDGQKAYPEADSSETISPTASPITTPPEVAGVSPESSSLIEQLRTEIAEGAAFLYIFEAEKASAIPVGMSCSRHIGTNGEAGYITLANGNPEAVSSGVTGGYSILLSDEVEAAASGQHITVRVIARASGSVQSRFAVAYSTNEVGNSGWRWFNAYKTWAVYTMEYDVPTMKNGNGDFVGILPGSEENSGTDFYCFAVTITKRVDIQGFLEQKNSARTIIVSSNCQTGGMAAALQEIFWKDKVLAVPCPNHTDDQILEHLSNADIWISSGRVDLVEKCLATNPKLVLYKIPALYFPAFHPDLIYTQKASTNEIIHTPCDYHSAICVWSYKNGLEVADTTALFSTEVYFKLGYFSMWKSSVDNLSRLFKNCNLDAGLFLPFIIRQGLFMHSINHPKINALIRLARIIAIKIDADGSILEKDINVSDGLTGVVWPVYPEIADFYALPGGSYDWKFSPQKIICGVSDYIEYNFNNYQNQGIKRDDIKFHGRDESVYDRVLGSIAGVKK